MSLAHTISLLLFSVILFFAQTYGYGTNGCQEIDDLLSDVWRIGDSNRLWPEHDSSLQQYCLNSIENNEKIISFFDKIYPDNFHVQIICRMTSIARTRLLMKFCKNKSQRAKALNLMKAMNKAVTKMERIRQETVNKLIAAAEPGSSTTFKDMMVILKKYEEVTINAITDKELSNVLKDIMEDNRKLVNFYLQNVKLTKLKRVNANPCPKEWRPYSLQYAKSAAFNRIFSEIE